MKVEFSGHFFEKYLKSNFMKIRPAVDELFNPNRRTDRHDKT